MSIEVNIGILSGTIDKYSQVIQFVSNAFRFHGNDQPLNFSFNQWLKRVAIVFIISHNVM